MKSSTPLTVTKEEKTFEEKFALLAKKITEIKNDIKALWKQLLKLEERTERLEERLERFEDATYKRFDQMEKQRRKDKDDIMNKFDYLIGKYETAEQENVVGAYQIRELREGFTNHEKRLKRLEHH